MADIMLKDLEGDQELDAKALADLIGGHGHGYKKKRCYHYCRHHWHRHYGHKGKGYGHWKKYWGDCWGHYKKHYC